MKVYLVGGCVRDKLLGLPVNDLDYVVVGATAAQMLEQGYIQVGADFPVFLHPQTRDEYALARTERKSGVGYHGFLVGTENVTLEEDLARRDLTINAMAQALEGDIVDPYGGRRDLESRTLRHVGEAFSEDPVRVLRMLRFRARLGASWSIASETDALARLMVSEGELSHLTAERVWKEMSRALMEPHAELFLEGLAAYGLWKLPPFRMCLEMLQAPLEAVKRAVEQDLGLESRFCLAFVPGSRLPSFGAEIPRSVQATAKAFLQLKAAVADASLWQQPSRVLEVLGVTGALREDSTFRAALDALACVSDSFAHDCDRLALAQQQALSVDTKAITSKLPSGPAVGKAIQAAREEALALCR